MPNWNLPWFPEWNKKNPTDVYGPAIVIGAAMGGLVVASVIMLYGSAYGTTSQQTGPRGSGMTVPEFNSDLAAGDASVQDYMTSAPIVPEAGAPLAKDAIENAEPLLGNLTVDNYERLVTAMRGWTGIPELLNGDDNYQNDVAKRMIQMTWNLNENWDGHVGDSGVNCYTCHRGEPVPSGVWFKIAPGLEAMEGWSANQNLATAQSVSTSLPHDALEKLLLEDGRISVHDLEPRVPGVPGQGDLASIQDTERTYSLMNYFANSLGVNCTFCHNTRAFYDGEQITPQWATASLGIEMVREMNNEYLIPLGDVLPDNRLGPKHGDAPKAACLTCHKGYQKPVGGMEMLADWPELASEDAPEYE
ncbi:MAG: photosynthetic reaction center cytochrome PufC [Pseudomonadota bacterium]